MCIHGNYIQTSNAGGKTKDSHLFYLRCAQYYCALAPRDSRKYAKIIQEVWIILAETFEDMADRLAEFLQQLCVEPLV